MTCISFESKSNSYVRWHKPHGFEEIGGPKEPTVSSKNKNFIHSKQKGTKGVAWMPTWTRHHYDRRIIRGIHMIHKFTIPFIYGIVKQFMS